MFRNSMRGVFPIALNMLNGTLLVVIQASSFVRTSGSLYFTETVAKIAVYDTELYKIKFLYYKDLLQNDIGCATICHRRVCDGRQHGE